MGADRGLFPWDYWPDRYGAPGRAWKSKQLLRVPASPCSPDSWPTLYAPTTKALGARRPCSLAYPQAFHSSGPASPPTTLAICRIHHHRSVLASMLLYLLFTRVRHLFLHHLFLTKFYPLKSKFKYHLKGSISSHLQTSQ